MGIEIGAQLDALWRSLFLGAAFALLYDGLRALRLRRRTRRALTDLLDALYCLFLAAALLAFTLRIGQGELRLYMLAFIALGAYLSFALLSPLLRPLWDFWADCLFAFARLLRAPLLPYCTPPLRSRRAAERRGGVQYGRGKDRAQKAGRRNAPEAAASRSAASHRRAPSEPPAGDQPR